MTRREGSYSRVLRITVRLRVLNGLCSPLKRNSERDYIGYIYMLCICMHCWLFQKDMKKKEKQKVILFSTEWLSLVSILFWDAVIQIGGHVLLKSPSIPIISVELIVKLLHTETQSNLCGFCDERRFSVLAQCSCVLYHWSKNFYVNIVIGSEVEGLLGFKWRLSTGRMGCCSWQLYASYWFPWFFQLTAEVPWWDPLLFF